MKPVCSCVCAPEDFYFVSRLNKFLSHRKKRKFKISPMLLLKVDVIFMAEIKKKNLKQLQVKIIVLLQLTVT